jgi:hypothetical protein
VTAAVLLLVYVCALPAEDRRLLDCRAREVQAETCALATAILEAGLGQDRLAVIAACVPTITRPAPAQRRNV